MKKLKFDPLNIVICGIGGQGNVLASEVVGSAMTDRGYRVAIGETYGASQRGSSSVSFRSSMVGWSSVTVIIAIKPPSC